MHKEDVNNMALPRLLEMRAHEYPDKIILEHVNGHRQTYKELYQNSRLWAEVLYGLGVHSNDPVCVMLPPSFTAHYVWLACGYLRAIEMPLNTDFRGPILSNILNSSLSRIIICASHYVERILTVSNDLKFIETIIVIDGEAPTNSTKFKFITADQFQHIKSKLDIEAVVQLHDISTVIYTSGTTGVSKGVLVPWGMFCAPFQYSDYYKYSENDTVYVPYPTYHISGKAPLAAMSIHLGKVVIREAFKTSEFWSDIRRHNCTHFQMLGAITSFLLKEAINPDDADNPLKHVIMIPVIENYQEFAERFGVTITTQYGSTELGPPVGADWEGLRDAQSCGRIREGWEYKIVDEFDYPVEKGDLGELVVRTNRPWTSFVGYWKLPEATVEAWRNGWFHTGDAFKEDKAGNLYFIDRIKDAIRRRGENISSFEVESIVCTHPKVLECAAVAIPSEYGEDDVKISVVLKSGEHLKHEDLIEYLVPIMPRFMIPRYIEFIDVLPKTLTQKVQKRILREKGISVNTWDRDISYKKL